MKSCHSVTLMDLESITLSKISQTETDKCHMISLTCGTFKNLIEKRGWWLQGVGVGEGGEQDMGKRGQEVQTSPYNRSRGVMRSVVTIVNNTVSHI